MSRREISLIEATELEVTPHGYAARLSRDWEIWGPNGGYLAALALRAAGMRSEVGQPASFYCHFLRAPDFDRVELDVAVTKRGRRLEAFTVQMTQRGELVLQALVRTAADSPGYAHEQLEMPPVPAPEAVEPDDWGGRPPFPFWENLERRPLKGDDPGRQDAAVFEWVRFRTGSSFGDPFVDSVRPLILLDTYGYPAVHRKFGNGPFVAPNLDTSVWFHRFSPGSEWLLIDHRCIVGDRGLLGVTGSVWDTEGMLIATGSAQLCCLSALQGQQPGETKRSSGAD